ncbi:hypothetical protein K6V25_13755 [Bacteroides salyersiae]|uniref:hypothetical protein n=1 Tax=Bacteroides salyersiae TaxID=291644 RepID=UPI001CCD8FC2|nr:hypothetical protein [Bacteroides salyersiae]UBD64005.1 hypothetical protein K6V25_13755 [Bacteroides salyersiae]
MLCKYVLTIDGIAHELPKSCIRNWDEIKRTVKRSDFGGIIRTFTSKFEFVGDAYDLLLNEWVEKYLLADARIAIYEINNRHTYDIFIDSKLDFGTFDNSGYAISMNTVDNSVSTLINANKGTQYEYLVDEIKEKRQLYYDRLDMLSTVNWVVVGESAEDSSDVTLSFDGVGYKVIPIYITSSEIYTNNLFEFSDVAPGEVSVYSGFLKAKKDATLDLSINIDFLAYVAASDDTRIILFKNGVRLNDFKWENDGINHTKINIETTLTLNGDDVLSLGIYSKKEKYTVLFTEKSISVKWKERSNNTIYIDVITPTKVLNSLLKSINGGKEGITGKIVSNYDSRLNNCVIVAAESIRGIPDAKLYTSYTKFVDWMEAVFGFVPVIEGNTVQFVHRNTLFDASVIKEFDVEHTDFTYSVDENLIYSSVRVGYDKQDYDSINGRDEFRFTAEFVTGIDITDNKLELISPYRSDAYGIEFLAQKRGKNTTDNESDNDVFFVGAEDRLITPSGICYRLIRMGWDIDGVLSPDTMFNVMFNQRSMLAANSKYIGISADKLEFTSSDGNSDVVINGTALKDDFIIPEKLATCGKVSFNTYDGTMPSPVDGVITLVKDGYVYKGFLSEADRQIERFDGLKYELIVQSISKV